MQRDYGLSLGDVVAGRVSLRRLRGLVAGLPHWGTALWRDAVDNPRGSGQPRKPPTSWWTPELDMLASLIDLGQMNLWMKSQDGAKGRNRPQPIERPGVSRGRRMGRTSLPQEQVLSVLRARGPQRKKTDDETVE